MRTCVLCMPVFLTSAFVCAHGVKHQVWKDGQKVDEFVGAAKDKLKALVEKYAGAPVPA